MKKCYYFLMVMLLTLVSVGFVSCGDDNDEPTGSGIVGTWRLYSSDASGASGTYGDYDVLMQFTKGGVYNEVEIFGTAVDVYHGTYTVSDNKLTVTYTFLYETETVECTYQIKGDKLTLTTMDGTNTFTRVKDSVIERYL